MGDVRAMLRVTDEFLWVLRREGISIATSQAVECLKAVKLLGFADRIALRDGLTALVARSKLDVEIVHSTFDRFFGEGTARLSLRETLARKGISAPELDTLFELLAARATLEGEPDSLDAMLGGGADFTRLLARAGIATTARDLQNEHQLGLRTQQLLARGGHAQAKRGLDELVLLLRGELGDERAAAIAALLSGELAKRKHEVRDALEGALTRKRLSQQTELRASELPLATLPEEEQAAARRAVKAFAEKFAGAAAVRRKHARKGAIDVRATLKRAARTAFVPMVLVRARKKLTKPKIWIVCDVSESVRETSRFMLELVAITQSAFDHARSFVFVSDLREMTALFSEVGTNAAIARAYGGGVVGVTSNSNYARAFEQLLVHYGAELDKRTTVVILGDGRTNFLGDGALALAAIRDRAKDVVWLATEPRSRWAEGDSSMVQYAHICRNVLDATTLSNLEEAVRQFSRLR